MLFSHRTHTRTFRHLTLPTTFNFVVDDIGAKIVVKHNADHIINTKKHYNITIDWNGENFCGIKLKWDYDKKNCRSLHAKLRQHGSCTPTPYSPK